MQSQQSIMDLGRIDYLQVSLFHNQHQRTFVAIYFRLIGVIMRDGMNLMLLASHPQHVSQRRVRWSNMEQGMTVLLLPGHKGNRR